MNMKMNIKMKERQKIVRIELLVAHQLQENVSAILTLTSVVYKKLINTIS